MSGLEALAYGTSTPEGPSFCPLCVSVTVGLVCPHDGAPTLPLSTAGGALLGTLTSALNTANDPSDRAALLQEVRAALLAPRTSGGEGRTLVDLLMAAGAGLVEGAPPSLDDQSARVDAALAACEVVHASCPAELPGVVRAVLSRGATVLHESRLIAASFGPRVSPHPPRILVVGTPADGSSALDPVGADSVVLLQRGGVSFARKGAAVEGVGGGACIVVQAESGVWPFTPSDSAGEGAALHIPVLCCSAADGAAMGALLRGGAGGEGEAVVVALHPVPGDVCSVCLEPFEPPCKIALPSCRHGFHYACLSAWFAALAVGGKGAQCPLCRVGVGARGEADRDAVHRDVSAGMFG